MKLRASIQKYVVGIFVAGYFFLLFSSNTVAFAASDKSNISIQQISQWQDKDVIYLGENHDLYEHHSAQLKIIDELYQTRTESKLSLAIALEMFQRPFQPVLDRYLIGEISETELREATEYDQRWGWDWEFYVPILRFAQVQQIPLIALNTPEEITHKVSISGIDSLQGSDYRYIPSKAEIDFDNQEYRQKLAEIYQAHVSEGQGNSQNETNFFAAQVLWDETMAEAIAQFYLEHPQSQIVVLVGKAHVIDNYAIPERVARRIANKSFKQTTYLLENK